MKQPHQPRESRQTTSELQATDRQALLDRFAEHPADDEIWQSAYDWARAEGDEDSATGIAADVPADELIEFAETVRSTPPSERYDLTIGFASNGRRWFDVLETFSSEQLTQAKTEIIRGWVEQTDPPTKFKRAIDLGTGTGNSLVVLEASADEVFGVYRNAALLCVADDVAGPNTHLVQAEVDALPFDDESFDLAASTGLTGSLDRDGLQDFYTELARILQPDGRYIELSSWPFDGYVDEQTARITASSKGMLADMIVETVSGTYEIVDHPDPDELAALQQELGLAQEYYDIVAADGETHYVLTLVTKTN